MPISLDIKQSLHHFDLAINVELASSHIIGLFGQSGSGKTTLLRAIAGLNESAFGTITFNNKHWQLNQKSSNKALNVTPSIGMVFQDSRLFEHLTVDKNLSIVDKLKSTDIRSKLITDFGINSLLSKFAHQLSAGQKQRVALIRSLIASPDLLLLDEPLSALDSTAKSAIMAVLKTYSQQHNLPMIYVSHHIDEIDYLCDELMLIEQGKLIDSGECQTLLSKHHLLPHQSDIIAIDNDKKQITLQLSDDDYNRLSKRQNIKLSD